jgi:pimeloyl-ACP methyl ester carboxylesterase
MTTASTYLDDPRFNREFILPACQAHQDGSPLRITYADYGYHGGDGNTYVFFGPLLGSRLLHVSQDDIAKKHKIRVLAVDRPGIGGTEPVNPDCRIRIWRGELDSILQTMLTANN